MTPSLLALRRTNPDVLVLSAASNDSIARIISNRNELGWSVPLLGNTLVLFYPSAMKMNGPNAYQNTSGIYYKKLTYCPGEASEQSDFAQFMKRMKSYVGETKVADYTPSLVAENYDEIYLLKAAIEGSGGKTDGPTLASWLKDNPNPVKLSSTDAKAVPNSQFLMPDSEIVVVEEPKAPDSNGMRVRAGCSAT
jgi:ABC-type branched-subunit amino acid transport system substrate-binding protein